MYASKTSDPDPTQIGGALLGIDSHYVSTFSFSNSEISMAENSDVRGPHLFAFVVFFFFFFSTNQRSVDLDFEVFPIRSVFFW